MTAFPNGRHDDQDDSTAQMLDWFKRGAGPSSNAGIFEYTRMMAEKLARPRRRRAAWYGYALPPASGRSRPFRGFTAM
jgi:hypothetical protein